MWVEGTLADPTKIAIPETPITGDTEEWMDVGDDVERGAERMEGMTPAEMKEVREMAKIVEGFGKFVDGVGGVGGAKVDGDPDSDDEEDDDNGSDGTSSSSSIPPHTHDDEDDPESDSDADLDPLHDLEQEPERQQWLKGDVGLSMRNVLSGGGFDVGGVSSGVDGKTYGDGFDVAMPSLSSFRIPRVPRAEGEADSDDESSHDDNDDDGVPSLSDVEGDGSGRGDEEEDKEDAVRYMAQMDAELAGTKVVEGFEMESGEGDVNGDQEDGEKEGGATGLGGDRHRPVDLDANLVRNVLESIRAGGLNGSPGHGLLGRMGVKVGVASGVGGGATGTNVG
ncbi:hypothetical protein HDU93_004908 [Gonapodya sp. JEL0774]|nr:hypothetical protein HDU93_004908 [Gonapodya sp. JEL0774]